MRPYADTNFYSRLYLPMAQTPEAERWLQAALRARATRLPIIWLHRVEFVNAMQLHVFAGKSAGNVRVTAEQAGLATESFRLDLADGAFLAHESLSESGIVRQAEDIALRHTAKNGFRTYDLLHVAAALLFQCDTFWSFDAKCAALAKAEGLSIQAQTF